MRLNEFSANPLLFKDVLAALQQRFGLERVGGEARVYTVGNLLGVAYLVRGGPKAIGLTWARGSKSVSQVFVWNHFNAAHSPDFVIDMPAEATTAALPAVIDFVDRPHAGVVDTITEDAAPAANDDAPAPAPEPVAEPIRGVQIMARNAAGELFVVPGMERTAAAIEARLAKESGGESKTMEQQYAELRDKVELVVTGRAHNIKSLLIYGAPSSGKTFTVMQVVKGLGLKEGIDYVVKKGSISDFAAYRAIIQNIDGLIIFDDCDSVVASKVGKNMIKGALDTYPVRELSYDNANTIDTDAMTPEDRTTFVDAMSRVMKGTASPADIAMFDTYAPSEAKKKDANKVVKKRGHFQLPGPDDDLGIERVDPAVRLRELQDYFGRRLPNKVDYRGRMIFISNMMEDEWDSAILTRTFRQYMAFGDGEMLDFIDRIKGTISAPALTDAQKQEVLDWIRHLHESGSLKSAINFRLVQQGFDLRLTSNWKSMIAEL